MIVTVSGVTLTAHRIHDDGVQAITTFRHHKRGLTGIEFSPDGKTFATCAEDGSIFIYDVATWKVRFHLRGHLQAIHGLRFSADGKRLASGGGGADAIKLWDVESGQEVLTISTRSTLMRNIRFSQDGRFLTGVSWNNRKPVLHLWQAPSLEAISNAIEAQAGD